MDSQPLDAVPEAAKEIPVEKASHAVGLSSGVIFLMSVAIQAIGLIATYFFSQNLGINNQGKAILGLVQFYLFVASSINGIGDLRIGSAYTFFISRGKDPADSTATYLVLRLVMVFVGGIALWSLGPFFRITSNGTSISVVNDLTTEFAFGLFLLLPLLWSISTVFTQLSVAQGQSIRGQYPVLIESIIRTSCLIFVATHHPTILTITLAYVPGALVSAVYSLPHVLHYYTRPSTKETKVLFRFAWPLMGSLMLNWTAANIVGLYVFAVEGTVSFNLFNAANGFRILALAVPAAVIVPLFPSLTSLHARKLVGRLRVQVFEALRYTAMAVVPGALCLIVYRVDFLATLLQPSYAVQATPWALAILAVSAIPYGLAMVIGTALNSVRLQRLELYLTSIQVGVLFLSAFTLGPPGNVIAHYSLGLGYPALVAAAIATLASSIAALAVNAYFMEKYLTVRDRSRPIITITAAAAAAFFAVSRFNFLINVHRWYVLLLAVFIGLFVYSLVLAALGELTKTDVRRIGGMVGLPPRVTGPLSRLCWKEEIVYAEPNDPLPADELQRPENRPP